MNKNTFEIDNITWNDLSLDEVYARLNLCTTTAGADYLYNSLKNPYTTVCEEFDSRCQVLEEVKELDNIDSLKKILNKIGKLRGYKFSDVLVEFEKSEKETNIKHFIIDILIIVTFAMIFVFPGPGMVAFFVMIAYSVSKYFKDKNIIAGKLMVFNYLIKIIKAFSKGSDIKPDSGELSVILARQRELCNVFKPFIRGTFIISEGARTTSNPVSILLDYVRMIFHIDIIKYNNMIDFLRVHIREAEELYYIAGEIDTAIAFRELKDSEGLNAVKICKPSFVDDRCIFYIENAYHPMLKNPVYNTIEADKNVLITGCNASGKSTFLKTVALNAIFAQSFGMVFADKYSAPYFKIYSSMALRDDINEGESYFMSEIKSLKRIVDECENNTVPILCVIDEVLRGTNTIERIAASVEILKSLSDDDIICFAATHDLELTGLLADYYDNYHFSEEVLNDDVKFSYKLMSGAEASRNAIRLLAVMGYSEDIVNKATDRANSFVDRGVWTSA